jgi:uncharacterized protein
VIGDSMRPERSPFLISVGSLSSGDHRDYSMTGPMEVSLDSGSIDGDVEVSVRVSALPDGVVATGIGAFRVSLVCHRCLAEWEEDRSIEILQVYQVLPDEDGRRIKDDGAIDLEPVVRDEVVLDIPLAPLCRPDCRGLCSVCGTDLNSDPCSGHTDESDHPLAALKQLLDPQDT